MVFPNNARKVKNSDRGFSAITSYANIFPGDDQPVYQHALWVIGYNNERQ